MSSQASNSLASTTELPAYPGWPGAAPADPDQTGGPGGPGDATYRDGPGDLRIDPRAIRRLAAWAANEVDGVGGASTGPIARAIHHPVPDSTTIGQLSVDLDLTVSIDYPRSVKLTVERMATHVAQRVAELTGRPVRDISVHVEHLTEPCRSPNRAYHDERSGRAR